MTNNKDTIVFQQNTKKKSTNKMIDRKSIWYKISWRDDKKKKHVLVLYVQDLPRQ